MLRPKLVKNGTSGIGHISGVVVVAYLIFGWSRPAFSVETTADSDEKPHLQLAPINFSHSVGGVVSYMYLRNGIASNHTTQQALSVGVTGTARVNSYFWQPWFSQVKGILMATVNDTRTHSTSTSANNTVSSYINGDVGLNLVKDSRFPFEGHIYRHDTRYSASSIGTSLATQLTGYSLSQAYETLNQRLTANAYFTNNKTSGPSISPIFSDSFNIDLKMQLTRYQSISISGNKDNDSQPSQGRTRMYETLLANHLYRPSTIFSVATLANLIKQSLELPQGIGPAQQIDSNSAQLSSFASLRPEKSPLTMTGSVRLITLDSSINGVPGTNLNTSNFNVGANYLFSPLIRMYGSVNVEDKLGTQTVSTNGALAAGKDYRASTNIGGFRYSGSIGGSLGFFDKTTNSPTQSTTSRTQSLGLHLSHALDKNSKFGGGQLARNLNQTIQTLISSSGSSTSTLGTGGSLSWIRVKNSETTQLRIGANDSRNLSGKQRIFDMINLQASRSDALSHNEWLQGNLTVQATHTQTADMLGAHVTSNTITPSANVTYVNLRAFKVLHLRFESILQLYDTNIAPTQSFADPNKSTRIWDNNFDYQIGLTSMQLKTRIAEINNIPNYMIAFMMIRSF